MGVYGSFLCFRNYSLVILMHDWLLEEAGTEEVKLVVSCGCSSIFWASPDPLLWNLDNHIYKYEPSRMKFHSTHCNLRVVEKLLNCRSGYSLEMKHINK